jgi:hypothetical protein
MTLKRPVIQLLMTGDVKIIVLLEPEIISLKGKASESMTAQMKITPTYS